MVVFLVGSGSPGHQVTVAGPVRPPALKVTGAFGHLRTSEVWTWNTLLLDFQTPMFFVITGAERICPAIMIDGRVPVPCITVAPGSGTARPRGGGVNVIGIGRPFPICARALLYAGCTGYCARAGTAQASTAMTPNSVKSDFRIIFAFSLNAGIGAYTARSTLPPEGPAQEKNLGVSPRFPRGIRPLGACRAVLFPQCPGPSLGLRGPVGLPALLMHLGEHVERSRAAAEVHGALRQLEGPVVRAAPRELALGELRSGRGVVGVLAQQRPQALLGLG